jgi:K+-sensing histidine kinase KdpD
MKVDKRLQSILAIIPAFVALALQLYFWSFIQPLVWFLFYPAVFLSAWIGGFWYGLTSTFLSILFVFLFFILPDRHISDLNPKIYVTLGVFSIMGTLFSILLGRLNKINQLLITDLRQKRLATMKKKNHWKKSLRS